MMLDEEALANEAGRMPLGAMPPPGPEPTEGMDPEMAGRPASPEEEKMFAAVVKQALGFLTSERAAAFLLEAAKAEGPDVALASAVKDVMTGVLQAAGAAGAQLPPEVQTAAAQIVVQTLAMLMAKGGLTDDPEGLAEAAMGNLGGGQDVAAG